jgi:hypothetical protein
VEVRAAAAVRAVVVLVGVQEILQTHPHLKEITAEILHRPTMAVVVAVVQVLLVLIVLEQMLAQVVRVNHLQ